MKINVEFLKAAEYMVLRNVGCCIAKKYSPTGLGQVLLWNEVLHRLGHDPRQILHHIRLRMTDVDFDRVENKGDLQREIQSACIQNEEANITEEEQVLVRAEKK